MVQRFTVEVKRPYSMGVDLRHQDIEGVYQLLLLMSADGGAYELKVAPEDADD